MEKGLNIQDNYNIAARGFPLHARITLCFYPALGYNITVSRLYIGIFAIAAAIGMAACDIFYKPWFSIDLTVFRLPIWILVFPYGALNIIYHYMEKRACRLSDEEIIEWGRKLEDAVPEIIDLIGQKVSIKEIAARMETTRGIPQLITLKYIIALGKAVKT